MTQDAIKILVVDDDPALLAVLEEGLQIDEACQVTALAHAAEAVSAIEQQPFDLVISDYSLDDPNINGLDVLRKALERPTQPFVVIITAFASLEMTLESIRLGAYDFLTKPFQLDELKLVARNAADHLRLRRENERLAENVQALRAEQEQLEQDHQALMERLIHLKDDEGPENWPEDNRPAGLDPALLHEVRRRRMREQIAHYARVGESIGERLAHRRRELNRIHR